MEISTYKVNDGGFEKGKVVITTATHEIAINTEYEGDMYYLASVFEDLLESVEVVNIKHVYKDLDSLLDRTKEVFEGAFINRNNELIFDRRSNLYFRLDDVETVLEFKCKMMAWLSRPITRSLSDYKARIILKRFNELLGANFSKVDMELIYDRLGNGVARPLCIKFIESNYDLSLLKR
ncbi:hypothetical protein P5815_03685 [Bacillus cereus]|uniref:hypothetical protein n=1 Tax=Bacillus cereus TaxID=1396 RepID=UPI001FAF10CB|nr:hypothetical protein [Bacillus cereus]MCJ0846036.1 hypothetical protein [Bacillus cereus]MDF9519673.1 hypothetical protein [Bacillus cereus]MDF9563404.1 hypothetical protein [Bacillus cereus]